MNASGIAAATTAMLMSAAAIAAEPVTLRAAADEPRAFGYTVGDVVSRRIALEVSPGLTLNPDSVPHAGMRGQALELQRVAVHTSWRGTPDAIELDYQVFLAPRETRVLEMPPIELRFDGAPRPQTLRIDAWPLTVAPLAPIEAPARDGLGELRPDREPPRVDASASRLRLFAEAIVAVPLLAYLAHVYLVLPWSARRNRPFGRAWTVLKALPPRPDPLQRRFAFERLHAALNQTVGEALFAPGIDAFVARTPRWAPLREDLARFFVHSRDEFYAPGGEVVDTRWLLAFARRCRELERGTA